MEFWRSADQTATFLRLNSQHGRGFAAPGAEAFRILGGWDGTCCPKMIVLHVIHMFTEDPNCPRYSHVYTFFFLERHTDICPACAYFGVAFAGSFRVTAMNPSEENDFSGWQMPFPFELPWHFAEIGGDGWAQKDGPQNFRINSRHTNGYQTWRSQHYRTYCIFTGEPGHTVPVLVV